MDELLNKLKKWVDIVQKVALGIIIFEAFLMVMIGIASNNVGKTIWTEILIVCVAIYFLILGARFLYQKSFPVSAIGELLAIRELEKKKELLERQTILNEFINHSIQGLNSQTCSIDMNTDNSNLCDSELGERLKVLINPLIVDTSIIFDTVKYTKFTIGIYLSEYYKMPTDLHGLQFNEDMEMEGLDVIQDSGIIILKDDLNIKAQIPKDLISLNTNIGAAYEIQTGIKRSLNNISLNIHFFENDEEGYKIISAEIQEVCDDNYANGVLFFIMNASCNIPNDIAEVLKIFNRIIANYVSKYNSCVYDRVYREKEKSINSDVVQILENPISPAHSDL